MLYSEIIAVCSQIHTKHINTLCGQNEELPIVKPGGTYSNHWALKSYELKIKFLSLRRLSVNRPLRGGGGGVFLDVYLGLSCSLRNWVDLHAIL
jgi:hypothetical protein